MWEKYAPLRNRLCHIHEVINRNTCSVIYRMKNVQKCQPVYRGSTCASQRNWTNLQQEKKKTGRLNIELFILSFRGDGQTGDLESFSGFVLCRRSRTKVQFIIFHLCCCSVLISPLVWLAVDPGSQIYLVLTTISCKLNKYR